MIWSLVPAPVALAFGPSVTSSAALIAVYEAPGAAPRVEHIDPAPCGEFIEAIATRVHQLTGEAGGDLPYTVVREVAENLIHAGFAEPVISILDHGTTVRFADQGPGIAEKDRAVLPGYTTASGSMKSYIRGVGSGLPIVRDFLSVTGGALQIEDNLGCGSVVTITSRSPIARAPRAEPLRPVSYPPTTGPLPDCARCSFPDDDSRSSPEHSTEAGACPGPRVWLGRPQPGRQGAVGRLVHRLS